MPDPPEGKSPEDSVADAIADAIRRATADALEAVRAGAASPSGAPRLVDPTPGPEVSTGSPPEPPESEDAEPSEESPGSAGSTAPADQGLPAEWALDAALGAATTAGKMATAVGRSGPARAAASAARFLARPLSEEGQEVRERLGAEAAPAAREVLSTVTPSVVEAIDLNEVLASVDLNALLDRLDLDRLLDRLDVSRLLERVDIDALVSRVDVGALVSRVDVDALISGVDVNALVSGVDIEGLLGRIDVNAIVSRVDISALLADLDLDAVLAEVDLDAVLDRLDLDAVIARIDIDRLVSNTELGAIVARSTTGVASEALDVVRSQGVSLDNIASRVVARVMRRDPDGLPAGPPLLVGNGRPALPSGHAADSGEAETASAQVGGGVST